MKKIALLLVISLFVISCNLPISINLNSDETKEPVVNPGMTEAPIQPTSEIVIPEATQTEAAPAPTELPAEGTLVESNGLSFVLPTCLAGNSHIEVVPADVIDPNVGPFFYQPQHRLIALPDYPLQNKFFDPEIKIYPVSDYDAVGASISGKVAELQNLINTQNTAPLNEIPTLPGFNAAQVFKTQVSYVDFQNGRGVRFLTEYAQYFAPISNYEMIYTYQGLTTDGKYWISAILPINATFLQEMPDSEVLPDGGISMPSYDSPTLDADMEAYYAALNSQLMMNDNFIPDIHCLDQFLASFEIND